MLLMAEWARSILLFRPGSAELLAGVPWIYKIHIATGMTLFLLTPFTRLVHVWSAPIWYLFRRGYQIVRKQAQSVQGGRLSVPVFVNGVEISDHAINAELQYHPAGSIEEAREAAARALVVRELLLQTAARRGIVGPIRPNRAVEERETDDEAMIRTLIAREVRTPEPDAETCRRFYDQNRSAFAAPICSKPHTSCSRPIRRMPRPRRKPSSGPPPGSRSCWRRRSVLPIGAICRPAPRRGKAAISVRSPRPDGARVRDFPVQFRAGPDLPGAGQDPLRLSCPAAGPADRRPAAAVRGGQRPDRWRICASTFGAAQSANICSCWSARPGDPRIRAERGDHAPRAMRSPFLGAARALTVEFA